MRYITAAMLTCGALALASPASAQLVNGLSGLNYNHETPIGAKGGGSPSSLQAPGEAAAISGALRNEAYGNNGHLRSVHALAMKNTLAPKRTVARNELSKSSKFSDSRTRLDRNSD